jgi:hypothetical protein
MHQWRNPSNLSGYNSFLILIILHLFSFARSYLRLKLSFLRWNRELIYVSILQKTGVRTYANTWKRLRRENRITYVCRRIEHILSHKPVSEQHISFAWRKVLKHRCVAPLRLSQESEYVEAYSHCSDPRERLATPVSRNKFRDGALEHSGFLLSFTIPTS